MNIALRGARHRGARRAGFGLAVALAAALAWPGAAVRASGGPEFSIVAPTEGAVVSSPVKVVIKVVNAEIGKPTDGLDHLHLSIDHGPEQAIYENRTMSLPMTPGAHTLDVELAGPTHAPLLPPKSVSFTVQ